MVIVKIREATGQYYWLVGHGSEPTRLVAEHRARRLDGITTRLVSQGQVTAITAGALTRSHDAGSEGLRSRQPIAVLLWLVRLPKEGQVSYDYRLVGKTRESVFAPTRMLRFREHL